MPENLNEQGDGFTRKASSEKIYPPNNNRLTPVFVGPESPPDFSIENAREQLAAFFKPVTRQEKYRKNIAKNTEHWRNRVNRPSPGHRGHISPSERQTTRAIKWMTGGGLTFVGGLATVTTGFFVPEISTATSTIGGAAVVVGSVIAGIGYWVYRDYEEIQNIKHRFNQRNPRKRP